ncbi:MAG: hypothetical protein HYS13_12245 [Planctomycetia bacterium]|nr:hypothetical protein [Planctomycetia bacterium]
MAENESLDLQSPGARRWDEIFDRLCTGQAPEEVAPDVFEAIRRAYRQSLADIKRNGVQYSQLLESRASPEKLNDNVRQAKNHPYALLLRDECVSKDAESAHDILRSFVLAIWQTMSDQFLVTRASPTEGRTLADLQSLVENVTRLIQPELDRLAARLSENPDRVPRKKPGKGPKADSTDEQIEKSLLRKVPR